MLPSLIGIDYLQALRGSPALLLLLRPDEAFTIVDATDAYLRATFTVREQVVGRALFDVFPDNPRDPAADGVANLKASLQRVLATRRADTMAMQKYDVRERGGEGFVERWWSPVNAPILAADGSVALIVHRVEDATALVRSQAAEAVEHAKLVEANARFQAIYEQGVFAARLDLDGVVTDVNRSALENCGFRREDVIGRPFWDCGWWNRAPDVQAWVKDGVRRAIAGEPFRGESRYFVADGSERVVEFACMPIKDEAGRVQFVVPTGIDITERASVQRDLRATEILDSITEGFFGLDREWRFAYVNREAERILGMPARELVGRTIWAAFPGLVGSVFEGVYRDAMAGNAGSTTAFYPDHARWYEVHAYPSPQGVSIYFRDVTVQREADAEREALAAAADRQRRIYETALSNTPDLVYIFDLDHRFIYANAALLAMWGRTASEAIGRDCRELGYEEWHAAMHDRELREVIATKRPIRGEVPFTGAQGRRIWEYIFVPVLGPRGEVVAVAGTSRDTTERREVEEAVARQSRTLQEADRAKDEFIATLSHELRNPLAPLRNAVALLRMEAHADERTAQLHAMMSRQLDHLVHLVDDLLEISRVSRGEFALRKQRVPVMDVVGTALESTQGTMQARRHVVTVKAPEGPLHVEVDPVRLSQIVANLLDNAAKYTPDGGAIEVEVREAGGEATVTVKDNGTGIAPESRERIFEMFNRGDPAAVKREGGLGIGLALARRLATMHGARLEAASEGAGRGSTFTLRIPLAGTGYAMPGVAAPAAAGSLAAKRVLVVDDNHDAADSLGLLLARLGVEVRIAHDGREALELFPAFDPNAVLLDIGMPGMDGYEVARALRDRFPERRASLIALTGWGQEQDRRRAREAGFDHHIVKPAELASLEALIGSL